MSKKPSKAELDNLLELANRLPENTKKFIPHYLGLISNHLDEEGNYQRKLLSRSCGGDFDQVVEMLENIFPQKEMSQGDINPEDDLAAGFMIIDAHLLLLRTEKKVRSETEGDQATRQWNLMDLKYVNWLIRALKVNVDQIKYRLEAQRQNKLEQFMATDYHYETEMLKNCLLCCAEKTVMPQDLKDDIELIRPSFSKLFVDFEEATRG